MTSHPTPEQALEALAAYHRDKILSKNGFVCQNLEGDPVAQLTQGILDAMKAALRQASGVEVTVMWQEIDKPWPGTNTRAYNGQSVDILLNGNARIPDVYFCYYAKEFLTCGTDVPVVLDGDPINKITHWMPHVHPVHGLIITPAKETP